MLGGGDEDLPSWKIVQEVIKIMKLPPEVEEVEYYNELADTNLPLLNYNITGATCALERAGYLELHLPAYYHTVNPRYYDDFEISPKRAQDIYDYYIHTFDIWKKNR